MTFFSDADHALVMIEVWELKQNQLIVVFASLISRVELLFLQCFALK